MIKAVMNMKLYFAENLKRLRKEKGLTQKALAARLGVAFQTISKWERGETHPDIMLLPEIAAFFGVTIDALLGADGVKRKKRIQECLALYDEMKLKDAAKVLTAFEKAVADFPTEDALQIRYMALLKMKKTGSGQIDRAQIDREITAAYDRIMRHSTDDAIRISAKRQMAEHLLWMYQCCGFEEPYWQRAKEIIHSLPSLEDSREYAGLALHCQGHFNETDWRAHCCRTIAELSYLLQNVIVSYCYYDRHFTPEQKLDIIRHMNAVLQLAETPDRPSKNSIHICYNLGRLGQLYAQTGKSRAALHYLQKAADLAATLDAAPRATGQNAVYYETEQRFRNMSMCERLYELMTKHYSLPASLKETASFRALTEKLQQH